MKKQTLLFVVLLLTLLIGCQSVMAPTIGMDRNVWLRQTLIADQVYLKGEWEVWKKPGGAYYYFNNGKLDHIDQGQLAQQRFQVEIINK